ncbi:hypothetical protein HF263_25700 [Rhizobium leguminosarum]|uniref:hypothetical protein n=1 Tax=Rhizobium leguminosarum TaxID=384 RepID=UPI001C903E09|nr:hypothetical protein [Rhizobium leguminosarum]MBY3059436.1 hypothetical protein [Rhizobium leguminosarum]
MPIWIQVLQALLTPAIAIGVGVIAYMQWRTAHQKVVLDLFDRRYRVYQLARDAVGMVARTGNSDREAELAMLEAMEASRFLFGKDVSLYLRQLYMNAVDLEQANFVDRTQSSSRVTEQRSELFKRVTAFYEEAPELFGRYMSMDQKRAPTPAEWLTERNRVRLSYADEKQR